MKPEDQAAFEAAYKELINDCQLLSRADFRDGFQAACAHRDAQPAGAQGEPVKFAKYFALTDAEGKYIKKDYFSGQLEIYEEENQVPCSHKETSTIAVYVTKTPTSAAAINEQLYTALEGLLAITRDSQGVAGYHLNGVVAEWDEFEEVSAAEAAITAAEAEKAKGGV